MPNKPIANNRLMPITGFNRQKPLQSFDSTHVTECYKPCASLFFSQLWPMPPQSQQE